MTKTQKTLKVLGLVILIGVIYGAYVFPKYTQVAGSGSGTGGSNSTLGFASVNVAPQSGSASSTSIYNGDSFDRMVISTFAGCQNLAASLDNTGAGVATLTLKSATTSVSGQGLQGNVNLLSNLTIGTSTSAGTTYVSTTTNPFANETARIWPSGTYITYNFNATSSAATCTIGNSYLRL